MPDVRDQIIDYINYWRERAEMPDDRLVGWIGITRSKYHALAQSLWQS